MFSSVLLVNLNEALIALLWIINIDWTEFSTHNIVLNSSDEIGNTAPTKRKRKIETLKQTICYIFWWSSLKSVSQQCWENTNKQKWVFKKVVFAENRKRIVFILSHQSQHTFCTHHFIFIIHQIINTKRHKNITKSIHFWNNSQLSHFSFYSFVCLCLCVHLLSFLIFISQRTIGIISISFNNEFKTIKVCFWTLYFSFHFPFCFHFVFSALDSILMKPQLSNKEWCLSTCDTLSSLFNNTQNIQCCLFLFFISVSAIDSVHLSSIVFLLCQMAHQQRNDFIICEKIVDLLLIILSQSDGVFVLCCFHLVLFICSASLKKSHYHLVFKTMIIMRQIFYDLSSQTDECVSACCVCSSIGFSEHFIVPSNPGFIFHFSLSKQIPQQIFQSS